MSRIAKATEQRNYEIPGGSHSTRLDSLREIILSCGINEKEIIWDVGVGHPRTALCLSAVTKESVIGIDTGIFCFGKLYFYKRLHSIYSILADDKVIRWYEAVSQARDELKIQKKKRRK